LRSREEDNRFICERKKEKGFWTPNFVLRWMDGRNLNSLLIIVIHGRKLVGDAVMMD
jgi:hypothetical protein